MDKIIEKLEAVASESFGRGKQLVVDVLQAIESDSVKDLPFVEDEIVNTVVSFVPGSQAAKDAVRDVLNQVNHNVTPTITDDVHKLFAFAYKRLGALVTPKPSVADTTPAQQPNPQ